jgi:hypothetical protein
MINTIWNWLNHTTLGQTVLSVCEVYCVIKVYNIGYKGIRKIFRRN